MRIYLLMITVIGVQGLGVQGQSRAESCGHDGARNGAWREGKAYNIILYYITLYYIIVCKYMYLCIHMCYIYIYIYIYLFIHLYGVAFPPSLGGLRNPQPPLHRNPTKLQHNPVQSDDPLRSLMIPHSSRSAATPT